MFSKAQYISGWCSNVDKGACGIHDHLFFEIVHHPAGTGYTEIDNWGRLDFSPGTTIIYPPFCAHNQVATRKGIDMVIHFTLPHPPELFAAPLSVHAGNSLHHDMEILSNPAVNRTPLQQSSMTFRLACLLCELMRLENLSTLKKRDESSTGYAELAHEMIRQHYNTIESIASIADEIGISYDYLRHVFYDYYGLSMQDVLINTRIERAKELLKHSTLPLKRIARLCGFGSDRHLCNTIRQRCRKRPSDYRNER